MLNDHDMKILAIDLGKRSATWCLYGSRSGSHRYGRVAMTRQAMHDLLVAEQPDRVVIEVGPTAGWVCDLSATLGFDIQVANTNREAWRWRNIKRKTDRRDALKLAQMSAMNQIETVHVPSPEVRAWRSLITYRRTLVKRRTQIKNNIRSILDREGLTMPSGKSGWTKKSVSMLRSMATFDEASTWRFELGIELDLLEPLERKIAEVERRLDALAQRDHRVGLLRQAPAVGPRLAEAVVAVIDDPHRFTRGRDVGCYAGLTARVYESGSMKREGRISGEGNAMLRSLLVEVAWLGVSRLKVPWMVEAYENVHRGVAKRKKIAIVAVARRLLIRCWAMMRDDAPWREPTTEEKPNLKLAA